MLVIRGLDDGLLERLGRTPADDIVEAIDVAPALPCREETGQGVCKSVLESRHHDASSGAFHSLHIPENEGSCDRVCLASTAAGDDDGDVGTNELGEALGIVEVDGFWCGRGHSDLYFAQ